jgi:N-acetylmuramic acid 6-phosphate etherase
MRSAEQAEDNEAAGAQAMADAKVDANDVVIGVAASGRTPSRSEHCGLLAS